jgi:hypothetical protein
MASKMRPTEKWLFPTVTKLFLPYLDYGITLTKLLESSLPRSDYESVLSIDDIPLADRSLVCRPERALDLSRVLQERW